MSLKFGLLGLLKYNDMTGYDLKKSFDSSLQFMWSAKSSQIYRELGKLENNGLVSSRIEPQENKFDRKVYSITPSGEKKLQEWAEDFPGDLGVPIRDEFILRVFFGENLSNEKLIFEIRRFKMQKEESLETLADMAESAQKAAEKGGLEESCYFWSLTIDKALKEIKAEIEWAEETITKFKKRS